MNDTFEHTTCDENKSCRDFPDLDRIVYDGTIDNNHLMKVFVPNQKKFLDEVPRTKTFIYFAEKLIKQQRRLAGKAVTRTVHCNGCMPTLLDDSST